MEDKGDYSFSTCWNIKQQQSGRRLIEEIKALGFRHVELNYNVTRELLSTIEPMIDSGEISISSVHNVFPYVSDKDYDTDSLMLGYTDESKRRRAVELLITSVEYARRYGAKAVVVHPGEVPFDYNIDHELKQLYREYGQDSPEYQRLWRQMADVREQHSPAYCERIRGSLEEVSEYVAKKGWQVTIGIETRSRCYQIPTLSEAKAICDSLQGSTVRLWYDIGHATMMDRMGLYSNAQELDGLLPYIYGVHIHETLGLSDHWCPYVHSHDPQSFDFYLKAIEAATLKVYELKAACSAEDIHRSHRLITGKLHEQSRIG